MKYIHFSHNHLILWLTKISIFAMELLINNIMYIYIILQHICTVIVFSVLLHHIAEILATIESIKYSLSISIQMDQYRRSEVNLGDVIGYFDILDWIKDFTYKICNCINVA